MEHVLPRLHLNTAFLAQEDRFATVRSAMSVTWDASLNGTSDEAFACTATAWRLGELVLNSRTSSGIRLARSARRARLDTMDHYQLNLMHDGGWIAEANGTSLLVPPGSIVLSDLARPMQLATERNRSVSLTIPRDSLERLLPARVPRHCVVLQGGPGALLADYLRSLEQRVGLLTPSEVPFVERGTCDLVAACVAPSRMAMERAGEQVAASLRMEARRVIDANLANPRLRPEEIAATLGVSRATLYRLFERDGGVMAFIAARRTRQAGRLLSSASERRRISEIAEVCGFESASHLSRVFRRELGASPSDVRAAASRGPIAEAEVTTDVVDEYQRWMRQSRA